MNLVESARKKARAPKNHKELVERQEGLNELVREFCSGIIGLTVFRERLCKFQEESGEAIVLNYSGPLYGFLRKLGLDPETSRRLTEEERAHFAVAHKEDLNPKIILEFSQEINEGETAPEQFLNIFVSYQIPEGLNEEEVRRIIQEISLAPKEPSEDDLDKLPNQGVIFP